MTEENIWKKSVIDMRKNPFARDRVDIIIPFHGCYDKVSRLVSGILTYVKSNPYQITLVDDASPNTEFVAEFKDFDKDRPPNCEPILKTIRNEKRLGFAGSLLTAYKATVQPWILVMHSDCIVQDSQFMIEMGRSLLRLRSQKVKLVSAKNQQSIPGVHPKIQGKRGELAEDVVISEGYLPLYCAMFHRGLFEHIGGFIKNYPRYEDQELGYRMGFYGFKQAICGRSFVQHDGGSTYDSLFKLEPEMEEAVEKNRDYVINDLGLLFNGASK